MQPQPHPPRDLKSCAYSLPSTTPDAVKTLGRLTTPDLRNAQTESSSNVNALCYLRNSSYICHKAINCQPHLNQGPAMLSWCLRQGLSVSSGCKAVGKHPADTRIICSQVWPGSWGWGGMRPRHRSHHLTIFLGLRRSQGLNDSSYSTACCTGSICPQSSLKSRGTSRAPSWDKPGCMITTTPLAGPGSLSTSRPAEGQVGKW